MRLKTILHVHTHYSHDSNCSPEELIATALRQGVDCLGITDHNELRGAWAAQADGRVRVIVGEEISTANGHLIGLFLQEWIPPGLSAVETAQRIRAQGGLVLAPHPFSSLCADSLGATAAELLPWLDAIEVCNAQNSLPWEDRQAAAFARRHGVAACVGADAHLRGYLAAGYQLLADFDGPASFLAALRQAELWPGRFGPAYLAVAVLQDLYNRLLGRRLPGFGTHVPEPGVAAPAE